MIASKIKFQFDFNFNSFQNLFSYGYKLMISRFYTTIFHNIYNLVIGKYFSLTVLGYYNRANRYSELAEQTISVVINDFNFPVLSSLKNNPVKLISYARKIIQITAFIIFPALTMVSILSEPLITILLGPKWLPVISILKIIVFTRFSCLLA